MSEWHLVDMLQPEGKGGIRFREAHIKIGFWGGDDGGLQRGEIIGYACQRRADGGLPRTQARTASHVPLFHDVSGGRGRVDRHLIDLHDVGRVWFRER